MTILIRCTQTIRPPRLEVATEEQTQNNLNRFLPIIRLLKLRQGNTTVSVLPKF